MQTFKTATGRMVCLHPERAFVNFKLQGDSLHLWQLEQPGMRTYEQLIHDAGLSLMQGIMYDTTSETEHGTILLQGCGKSLSKLEKDKACAAVLKVCMEWSW